MKKPTAKKPSNAEYRQQIERITDRIRSASFSAGRFAAACDNPGEVREWKRYDRAVSDLDVILLRVLPDPKPKRSKR